MARSLGTGIVEFKKGLRSGDQDNLPKPGDSSGEVAEQPGQPERAQQSGGD